MKSTTICIILFIISTFYLTAPALCSPLAVTPNIGINSDSSDTNGWILREDSQTYGAECNFNIECISKYCVHNKCRNNTYHIGDSYCDYGENYENSPSDCNSMTNENCGSDRECISGNCYDNKCRTDGWMEENTNINNDPPQSETPNNNPPVDADKTADDPPQKSDDMTSKESISDSITLSEKIYADGSILLNSISGSAPPIYTIIEENIQKKIGFIINNTEENDLKDIDITLSGISKDLYKIYDAPKSIEKGKSAGFYILFNINNSTEKEIEYTIKVSGRLTDQQNTDNNITYTATGYLEVHANSRFQVSVDTSEILKTGIDNKQEDINATKDLTGYIQQTIQKHPKTISFTIIIIAITTMTILIKKGKKTKKRTGKDKKDKNSERDNILKEAKEIKDKF